MMDPIRDQATGDNSSSSEYFTCVSCDSKMVPIDKHGKADSKVGSELRQEVQLSC